MSNLPPGVTESMLEPDYLEIKEEEEREEYE